MTALDPGSVEWLRRYARQLVLREVGEGGQRRLGAARAVVEGLSDAGVACAVLLAAAGVGETAVRDERPVGASRSGAWPLRGADPREARDVALVRASTARGQAASVAPGTRGGDGVRATLEGAGVRAAAALVLDADGALRVAFDGAARDGARPAEGDGPLGAAAGALLADAVVRAFLAMPGAGASLRVSPDATVSTA